MAEAGDQRYKWSVLSVVGVGTFMSALDGSIVNITLPRIQAHYDAALSAVGWVPSAYLLTISGLLLIFGRLGDMLGYKKVYSLGYGVFGLGSLACGLAPTLPMLIAARVLQGLGAAMLMAIAPALVTTSFPGRERGRALGLVAALTYTGLTVGPSLGGFITGRLGWHWVFLINVPVAAAGAALALGVLRPVAGRGRQRFDIPGAFLFVLGLVALMLAMSRAEAVGWTSPGQLALLVGAALALAGFLWHESHTADPIMPLGLFSGRVFTGAMFSALLHYTTIFMLSFLMPFYLMDFRAFSPEVAGAVLTAQPVTMVISSPLAGALADRYGTRWLRILGMLVIATGLLGVGLTPADATGFRIIAPLVMVGLGSGLFSTPNNSALMGAAPRDRQGIAAGLMATARNVGMVTGVAVAGMLFATLQARGLQEGLASGEAFLGAFRTTEWTAAALAVVAALMAVASPGSRGRGARSGASESKGPPGRAQEGD